jgi:hypothetical protein
VTALLAQLAVPNNDPVIPPPLNIALPDILNEPETRTLPVTEISLKLPESV